MMKKLIILFCSALALSACGNEAEKKANEKLTAAKAAFESGNYEEAKLQMTVSKYYTPKHLKPAKPDKN